MTLSLLATVAIALAGTAGPAAPSPAPLTVDSSVCLIGDSISLDMLRQDRPNFTAAGWKVVGIGFDSDCFSGYTAHDLGVMLDEVIHPTCNAVMIQAGTNDLFEYQDVRYADADMQKLLTSAQLRFPGVQIYVEPITPLRSPVPAQIVGLVDPFNSSLAGVVAGYKGVKLLPTFTSSERKILASCPYTPDGIHPLGAGLDVIATREIDALTGP